MPKGDTILKAQPMDYSKVNYLLGYVIHTFNRSQLLCLLCFQAFHCIFTSPTSSREEVDVDDNAVKPNGPPEKKYHIHRNVTSILKMWSVQPHAITYVAIQVSFFCDHFTWYINLTVGLHLRFALSSCTFWTIKDDNFDYEIFYHNIVDWFELPTSAARSREVKKILHWWNR